jgi:hypothetical protein
MKWTGNMVIRIFEIVSKTVFKDTRLDDQNEVVDFFDSGPVQLIRYLKRGVIRMFSS